MCYMQATYHLCGDTINLTITTTTSTTATTTITTVAAATSAICHIARLSDLLLCRLKE